MSDTHRQYAGELQRRLLAPATDIAALLRPELTPAWGEAIQEVLAEASAVVLSHPYGLGALGDTAVGRPLLYDAHNVEADLKAGIIGETHDEWRAVCDAEARCAREADLVICCSASDAERLHTRYALSARPLVVANGVDTHSYTRPARAERAPASGGRPLALFVGSLHGPNVSAARAVVALAREAPQADFALIGSVCEAAVLQSSLAEAPAENLRLIGRVEESELRLWLSRAQIGLNPVTEGSGTNLKLLQYAAAGLPILSTAFGARGSPLRAGVHYLEAPLERFAEALATLTADGEATRERADRARDLALESGDWRGIAATLWRALEPLLDGQELPA